MRTKLLIRLLAFIVGMICADVTEKRVIVQYENLDEYIERKVSR